MATPEEQIKFTLDTINHVKAVQYFMEQVVVELVKRARVHDGSKLNPPEWDGYAQMIAELKGLEYNSPAYRVVLQGHSDVVRHHYQANDHHPEHFAEGIAEMNLIQIVEMFCDWKAASMRNSGTLVDSLESSCNRFGIDGLLGKIFVNTVRDLQW